MADGFKCICNDPVETLEDSNILSIALRQLPYTYMYPRLIANLEFSGDTK